MITFKDILKANARFLWVLILCTLIFFGIIFGIKFEKNTYESSVAYLVKNDDTTIVDPEKVVAPNVDQIYSVVKEITNSDNFYDLLSTTLKNKYNYDYSASSLKKYLIFSHKSGEIFISASFKGPEENMSENILNESINAVISKYKTTTNNNYVFEPLYPISTIKNKTHNAKYALISILVGLIIGELLIVCFVFANPYVDSEQILERSTELKVLSSLEKIEGEKNEKK